MTDSFQINRFDVDIEVLMNFIFDPTLQWPLAAGRLFAFALYGPLNSDGVLCTGFKGKHVLSTWELDEMCMQIEKEDMLQIYLHRGSDMPLLSTAEQEAIIGQADAHLKRAKGKASLPRLSKEDVYDILKDIPTNPNGTISFHEAQKVIVEFRKERIKQYKLVYPSLTTKKKKDETAPFNDTSKVPEFNTEGKTVHIESTETLRKPKRQSRVSECVAPKTMFLKMKGQSNSDMIETANRYLHQYTFKIGTLESANSPSMMANVRLLREIVPNCDGYHKNSKDKRVAWDETSNIKHIGLGSLVKATPSSSTWKRNSTLY